MRPSLIIAIALLAATPVAAVPVSSADFLRATDEVRALAEATRNVPGAAPAMAIVAVRRGMEPVIMVWGTRDVRTGAKADADTPFYIASMTKAYMGLLAAELDRQGVLDLDSTLADHWPGLRIPGTDTRAMTLSNLLTHHMLFRNGTLTFRTAYTDLVPAADYPAILATSSTLKKPGFAYDNLGYLLYAAILEKETGKSWKDWLDRKVFRPLGMSRTSARSSIFSDLPAAHQWTGDDWYVTDMKTDAVMHAAGGIVTSPRDMARWLSAQIGDARGEQAAALPAAHAVQPYAPGKKRGRVCDGYAFGWHHCTNAGFTFFEHGGGYTGFRSQMMIAPDRGVGFAVLTNSDSVTGALSEDLMMAFISALAQPGTTSTDPHAFAADYAKLIEKQKVDRDKQDERDRGDPKWGGWSWKPDQEMLRSFAGRYRSPTLGEAILTIDDEGLMAKLGALQARFRPASSDTFAAGVNPFEKRAPVRFERDGAGNVVAMDWDGDRFTRSMP